MDLWEQNLKTVADTSVTKCDEIVIMNNLSTKKRNTITTNVTSTASINCQSKKVREYFPYSFTSNHITIDDYYHYLLSLSKTKR